MYPEWRSPEQVSDPDLSPAPASWPTPGTSGTRSLIHTELGVKREKGPRAMNASCLSANRILDPKWT